MFSTVGVTSTHWHNNLVLQVWKKKLDAAKQKGDPAEIKRYMCVCDVVCVCVCCDVVYVWCGVCVHICILSIMYMYCTFIEVCFPHTSHEAARTGKSCTTPYSWLTSVFSTPFMAMS